MLKVIGSIERLENPKVSLATWREVIEAFELRPIESCEVANPYTGEPTTLNTSLELAALVIDERSVGVVRWCSRGEGLDIIGEPDAMIPLAESIAARIGGEFVPL
jgi:hypothetical protein